MQHTEYIADNSLPTAQVVMIEQRIQANAELVETPAPESQTAEQYRWDLSCPTGESAVLRVHQRTYHWQVQEVLDRPYTLLAEYLERRWLDRSTLARLRMLLEEHVAIKRNAAEQERLQAERVAVYAREEQLRQNMAALGNTGAEAPPGHEAFLAGPT